MLFNFSCHILTLIKNFLYLSLKQKKLALKKVFAMKKVDYLMKYEAKATCSVF